MNDNNDIEEIRRDYEKINEKIISAKGVELGGKYVDKLLSDVVNFEFHKINNIILLIINCIMPSTLIFFLEKRELFTGLDFPKLIIIIVAINLILLYGFVLLRNLSGSFGFYLKYLKINFLRLKFSCTNLILKKLLSKLEYSSGKLYNEVSIINTDVEKLTNFPDEVLKSKENIKILKSSKQKAIYVEKKRKNHLKKIEIIKIIIKYQENNMSKIDSLDKIIEDEKLEYTMNQCFEWYLKTNIAINFMLISIKTLMYVNILNVTLKDYQWTLLAVCLYVIFNIIDIMKVILIILFGTVSDIMRIIWKKLQQN